MPPDGTRVREFQADELEPYGPHGNHTSAATHTHNEEGRSMVNGQVVPAGTGGRVAFDEQRVYRQFALPVSAFDILKDLKRAWGLQTNAEVVTRLLLTVGSKVLKNDETQSNADDTHRR